MGNIYFVLMVIGLAYSLVGSVLALLLIKYDPVTYKLYYKHLYGFVGVSYVVGLIASLSV